MEQRSTPTARDVFDHAMDIPSPDRRRAYVNEACADDAALRQKVDALVRAYEEAGSFLESPPVEFRPESTVPDASTQGCEGPGSAVGRYKLLERIGEGGFGTVYMAEQQHPVRRKVALKIIKAGMDTRQVIARFEAERQALALMDHPNIARVLDAGATDTGRPYFVMELVRGVPITDYCDHSHLAPRQRLELFAAVCHAVQHAHQKGIIHRDLKPTNVLVTLHDGVATPKVIDFGIAKATGQQLTDKTLFTHFAQMVGTPLYMSPEQAEMSALDADTRSDVYSLGVLLYELLTGTTPFDKERLKRAAFDEVRRIIREEEPPRPSTRISTMGDAATVASAHRGSDPKRLGQLVRGELDWIVMKALEKDRTRRYETASALAADVKRYLGDEPVSACPPTPTYRLGKFARRNRWALTTAGLIAAALLAGIALSTWQARRATRAEVAARDDRDRALAAEAKTRALGQIPTVDAYVRAQRYEEAFELLQAVEAVVPSDARLAELRTECSWVLSIDTDPPGVTVWRKPPDAPDGRWVPVGTTPIKDRRLARGVYHWRFEKPGFVTAEGISVESPIGPAVSPMGGEFRVELDAEGSVPAAMVRVRPYGPGFFWRGRKLELPQFWIDRFEVTNRRFKAFVDGGGYRRRELWAQTFERNAQALSWEQAMALFHDTTGRPGPGAWADGTYPRGQEDFPVSGVSWYEADAFARFEGKALPTIYHWHAASGRFLLAAEIIPRSNFGGAGPAPVGRFRGLNQYGAYDMAGNVKEWCWNSAGEGKRYVLGGAWDEPSYTFSFRDFRSPIDREKNVGFRCVKYHPGEDAPAQAFEPNQPLAQDVRADNILGDGAFEVVKGLYAYDKAKPLNSTSAHREETAHWVHEQVTVDAAYGSERLAIHLYLPKTAKPPYQAIIYWPGAGALYERVMASPEGEEIAFLVRSGRALVCPTYLGTRERQLQPPEAAVTQWEHTVHQAQDLFRTVDYLAARPGDFDVGAIGYYGVSWGAAHAVRAVALEDRIKAAVLVDGGLIDSPFDEPFARPEHDPVHYLPRVTIPVLMLNGKYDSIFPPQESQEPMFRLLGTEPGRKRYRSFEVGHRSPLTPERAREAVGWFDQYLGPVKLRM